MKILVAGYYGFNNLGDEWSLEIMINDLKHHTDQITVLSNQPNQTKLTYNVNSISRWHIIKVLRSLFHTDMLIIGGGSIIQDMSSFKSPLYYLGLGLLAKLLGKKVIMLSQGFGPIKHKFNMLLCQLILPWLDKIIARDHDSLLSFQRMGIDEEKLVEAADLVWLKDTSHVAINKNQWLIILRADWLKHEIPSWLSKLVQYGQSQKKIMAFLALSDQEDSALIAKIQTNQQFEQAFFYNSVDWEKAYLHAELVISMRYHGLLLGALNEAMLIGLGHDPKIITLLDTLHQLKADPYDLLSLVQHNADKVTHYQQLISAQKPKLIKLAKQNLFHLETTILENNH